LYPSVIIAITFQQALNGVEIHDIDDN